MKVEKLKMIPSWRLNSASSTNQTYVFTNNTAGRLLKLRRAKDWIKNLLERNYQNTVLKEKKWNKSTNWNLKMFTKDFIYCNFYFLTALRKELCLVHHTNPIMNLFTVNILAWRVSAVLPMESMDTMKATLRGLSPEFLVIWLHAFCPLEKCY